MPEYLHNVQLGPVVWSLLALFGCFGVLALVSPGRFRRLTQTSSRWVDTQKLLSTLDTPIDVDRYVLPFSRALGAAVLIAVAVIGYLFATYLSR